MLQLEPKQINPKLKFYIMKKRQQKKQEIEAECLRQEKQAREQILTELNELHEKFSILEKELSNYIEKKDQLLKELDVTNKILKQTEVVKIQKMNNNRNMVIKKNSVRKNREHLTHHKIALQNKIIDALPLFTPIVQTPLMTISADSLSPAIYSNKTHVNKKLPSNLNSEVQLKTNLHVPKLHSPLTLGIMTNDSNHKSAFSPFKKYPKLLKSTPKNSMSQFTTISADNISPAIFTDRTYVNKKLPSMLNDEVQLKTNLHVPKLHSSLTLGIMTDDPNHKSAFSPFKKFSKPVKLSPKNFKSQNKTQINKFNLHSLKENKDINKQDICDDNFADIKLNQDIDVRIRRSRISFDYSHLSSAQLQLNPSSVSSLYPYSPYLSDINPNLNLHASSTYITSNINPNFVPSLTYANQIPLLSSVTCDGTFYMNPTYLAPIYSNTSHKLSSLILVSCSNTSHITSTSLPTVIDVKSTNNSPSMVTTRAYFNTFCGNSPSCKSSRKSSRY